MKNHKLKAFCKINLSLRVSKKLSNGYHKIQSFISFGDLYDEIYVSEIKKIKDKIIFSGRFKKGISAKSNTVVKVLKFFRQNNMLKNKIFRIKIKKNIPHGSGLGGGSSDAASLINFFNSKMKLKLNNSKIYKLANLVGSDVPCNLIKKNLYLTGKKMKILKLNNKFNILIVFPNIWCSTRRIYSKNRSFSSLNSVSSNVLNNKRRLIRFLQNEHNDLEKIVVTTYPIIGKIIRTISIQKGCYFSRLTGSGSACIGLFSNNRTVTLAKKIIKRKFPCHWYAISKTI